MKTIPNFKQFSGNGSGKSRRVNEANSGKFFKTYEETENWLIEMEIDRYTINPTTLVVDTSGDVDISLSTTTILVQFGNVGGDFICSRLSTLLGCPKQVAGSFSCRLSKLQSLEFMPEKIGGDFSVGGCGLTSLKGMSNQKEFYGDFWIIENSITSLQGCPDKINGRFFCGMNELIDLVGGPSHVGEDYSCSNNKLVSLNGAPSYVGGDFNCTRNQLLTMKSMDVKMNVAKAFYYPKQELAFDNVKAKKFKSM